MRDLYPFIRMLGRHRLWMGAGALMALVTLVASAVLFGVAGAFVAGAAIASAGSVFGFAPAAMAALIRWCAIIRTLGRYGDRVVSHEATFRALADLRVAVFRWAIPLAPAKLGRLASGDLLSRITSDVDALDALYLRLLVPTGLAFLTLIGGGVFLLFLSPGMAAAFAVPFCLVVAVTPFLAQRAGRSAAMRVQRHLTGIRSETVEGVRGLSDLLLMGRAGATKDRLMSENASLTAAQMQLAVLSGAAAAATVFAGGITIALVIWIGVPLLESGTLTVTLFAVALFVSIALFEIAGPIAGAWGYHGKLAAAARRLTGLAEEPPTVLEGASPLPSGDSNDLVFDGVGFAYGDRSGNVLRNIDLTLPVGGRVALMGESGSGKSTFAHLALRFWDPDEGEIRLGGRRLTDLSLADLRRRVGLLSQRPDLFQATLAENLRIGKPSASDEELWSVLQAAGLAERVEQDPLGLEAMVGEQGLSLSGGQARRLALARLMLADPAIWILDEPTEGLDADTEAALWRTLDTATTGKTVLLIAHRGVGLTRMDRVLRLIDGRLVSGI